MGHLYRPDVSSGAVHGAGQVPSSAAWWGLPLPLLRPAGRFPLASCANRQQRHGRHGPDAAATGPDADPRPRRTGRPASPSTPGSRTFPGRPRSDPSDQSTGPPPEGHTTGVMVERRVRTVPATPGRIGPPPPTAGRHRDPPRRRQPSTADRPRPEPSAAPSPDRSGSDRPPAAPWPPPAAARQPAPRRSVAAAAVVSGWCDPDRAAAADPATAPDR